MRDRMAALLVLVLGVAFLAMTYTTVSTPHSQEETAWHHIPHPSESDPPLRSGAWQPIITYVRAVEDNEAAAAFRVAEARQRSATTSVVANIGANVPTTTTTPPPVVSASGDIPPVGDPSVWSCIITHESHWDPTAVNPSSGAGGLFQFLPSTWQGLGFGGVPEDASVATQVAAAAQAYSASYWNPWIGDGCTPLG